VVLVVCPKSVIQVWPKQFREHAAIPYTVVTLDEGSVAQRTKQLGLALELASKRNERVCCVLNYESAWREPMAAALLKAKWDCVCLDESHRIKAPGGQASKFFGRLGDNVLARVCLTGTPMPHSPLGIYAQYRFLDKGIYGTSFTAFRNRYAEMGGYGNYQVMGYVNQDELQRKFYSIAFRVMADDVQDLPETMDLVRPVILSPGARKVYEQLNDEFVAGVDMGKVTVTNALTKLLRLQQITSGFVTLDTDVEGADEEPEVKEIDTAKAEVLLDILEDLKTTEPVAIFCRFQKDLDTIKDVAKSLGRGCAELSGRMNELKAWQEDTEGKLPLIAVQMQAGGVGVDLVRSHYCVFYSLGFSLGDYLQARKRTHRPGQNERVTYFHLIAEKTVDETVYEALHQRQNVVDSVLSTVRGRHTNQEAASCK
jgi:SNF2 family DNA or RNA helicase